MSGRGRPRGGAGAAAVNNANISSSRVSGSAATLAAGTSSSSTGNGGSSRGGSPSTRSGTAAAAAAAAASGGTTTTTRSRSLTPIKGGKTRGGGMRGGSRNMGIKSIKPNPNKRRSSSEGRTNTNIVMTTTTTNRKTRRPKFQDNPQAPEIVEKRALKSSSLQDKDKQKEQVKSSSPGAEEVTEEEVKTENGNCDKTNGHHEEGEDEEREVAEAAEPEMKPDPEENENRRKRRLSDDGDNGDDEIESKDKEEVEAKKAKLDNEVVSGLIEDLVSTIATTDEDEDDDDDDDDDEDEDEFATKMRKLLRDKIDSNKKSSPNSNSEFKSLCVKTLHKKLNEIMAVKDDVSDNLKDVLIKVVKSSKEEHERLGLDWKLDDDDDERIRELLVGFLNSASSKTNDNETLVTDLLGVFKDESLMIQDGAVSNIVNNLDKGMVPVESETIANEAKSEKPPPQPLRQPLSFDKTKLFSQMEDKFAKDTHKALKNKPVNKRRKPITKESEDIIDVIPPVPQNEEVIITSDILNEEQEQNPQILIVREPIEIENKENLVISSQENLNKDKNAIEVSKEGSSSSSSSPLPPLLIPQEEEKQREPSKTPPPNSETPPPPPLTSATAPETPVVTSVEPTTSMTTTTSSSEIIKSLRKVRVRCKAPRSPSSNVLPSMDLPQPLPPVPPIQEPSALLEPPVLDDETKEEEPKIRPKIVLSITQKTLSKRQKKGDESSPSSPPSLNRKKRIVVSPTILSKVDAEAAAEAVRQVSPAIKATITSTGSHPSLKTVIRLPPKMKKKKKKMSDHHHHHHHNAHSCGEEEEIKTYHHKKSSKAQNNKEQATIAADAEVVVDDEEDEKAEGAAEANAGDDKNSPDSQPSTIADDKLAAPESMVVPEKASSFNIHPERCCSDTCHYCGLKFGILDTPLHVSQLKTPEIRKFAEEFTGFEKDACLCDKCFRFLDRTARNKGAENEAEKKKREEANHGHGHGHGHGHSDRVRKCLVRNCNREVTDSISKKWLIRLKKKLIKKLALDWERVTKASVKATFPVCTKHNSWVEYYSLCGLCKRKLNVGGICTLGMTRTEVQELNALLRDEDGIPAELFENVFVCKLCRTFCSIKQKMGVPEYLKTHKSHKAFYKDYKKRLYTYLGIEGEESEESSQRSDNSVNKTPKKIHQVSQSDNPTKITIKTTTLDVPAEPSSSSNQRSSRKRRVKEFASPSSESRIHVETEENDLHPENAAPAVSTATPARDREALEKCSVTIQFDLNTKKLWQDLHFPYGNYTSFFRHLILLEKYWRNGDLALSETANQKASVYIRSVHNRIKAYEGRHKRSEADLSASTRPDLSVPAPPPFIHEPYVEDDDDNDEDFRPNEKSPSPTKGKEKGGASNESSTILKIPKIPMPPSNSNPSPPSPSTSPTPPTKIRVRTDLMHLGLMERSPVPNLMEQEQKLIQQLQQPHQPQEQPPQSPQQKQQQQQQPTTPNPQQPPTATTTVTNKKKLSPHTISSMLNNGPQQPNRHLIQLLNDPVQQDKSSSSSSSSPNLTQSSNSQLFKEAGSGSAIPLTFNNSIAEVLAAANKANKANKDAAAIAAAAVTSTPTPLPSSKPEITITSKPLPPRVKVTTAPSTTITPAPAMVAGSDFIRTGTSIWPSSEDLAIIKSSAAPPSSTATAAMTSPSSGGGLSIQKSIKPKQASPNVRPSPLIDMSKLLRTQAPALPPHLVAQQNHLGLPTITPKPQQQSHQQPTGAKKQPVTAAVAPQSPAALVPNVPIRLSPQQQPVQKQQANKSSVSFNVMLSSTPSSGGGQKKNLNNILNRLSVLKSTTSNPIPKTTSSPTSSLVQQLQSPPMISTHPHLPNVSSSARNQVQLQAAAAAVAASNTSQQQKQHHQQQQQAAAAAAAAQQLIFLGFPPGQMVGQPMVQYPDWLGQAQATQALMMAGALPGMTQVQAAQRAAAIQELMNLSMVSKSSTSTISSPSIATRIRAPPPLTHMGKGGTQKSKPD